MTPKLVLASQSPRRKVLLASLGVPFEVMPSGAEEIDHGALPTQIVINNARLKCSDIAHKVDGPTVIIAADTLVFLDGDVLSKPSDAAEARAMLGRLSGNTHHVVTGLALLNTATGQQVEGSETTAVSFRPLNTDEIDRFVDIVNPIDRAGAYTVDGPGSLLVARYDGCYYNVLGLPLVKLDMLLRQLGVNLFEMMHPEHAVFL